MRFFAKIFMALFVGGAFLLTTFYPKTVLASLSGDPSLAYLALSQHKESGGLVESGDTEPSAIQSAWGAIAFASAGIDPGTVGAPSLLQYVEKDACSYTSATDIERTILVALASGGDPRNFSGCDLLSKLNSLVNEDGSIGPDIVSTIFGTIAKSASGNMPAEKTFNFIIGAQQKDGGWDSGWGTEANITAQALIALSYKNDAQSSAAIAQGKNYLKGLQTSDGGIKYDNNAWTTSSDAFSNAYTLQAIHALGEKETDGFWLSINGTTITDDLISLRTEEGSYNFSLSFGALNPVFTTAVVIPALYGKTLGFIGNNLAPYAVDDKNSQENSPPPPPPSEETQPNENEEQQNQNKEQPAPPPTFTPKVVTPYNEYSEGDTRQEEAIDERHSETPTPSPVPLPDEGKRNNSTLLSILIITGSALAGFLFSLLRGKSKIFSLLILGFTLFSPTTVQAGRAGIVVRHGDGRLVKKCVDFGAQESITGAQLLEKSGLNPQFYNGFIFAINGESAKKYNEPGAGDDYWSYWRTTSTGNWLYASLGAKSSRVKDGEVDGWQRGGSSLLLPAVEFNNICSTTATVAQATPLTTGEPPPLPENAQKKKLAQQSTTIGNRKTKEKGAEKETEDTQAPPPTTNEDQEEDITQEKSGFAPWLLPVSLSAFLLGLLLPRILKK